MKVLKIDTPLKPMIVYSFIAHVGLFIFIIIVSQISVFHYKPPTPRTIEINLSSVTIEKPKPKPLIREPKKEEPKTKPPEPKTQKPLETEKKQPPKPEPPKKIQESKPEIKNPVKIVKKVEKKPEPKPQKPQPEPKKPEPDRTYAYRPPKEPEKPAVKTVKPEPVKSPIVNEEKRLEFSEELPTYYGNVIDQQIQKYWKIPMNLAGKPLRGITIVKFMIEKNGAVKGVHVVKSSGDQLLDQYARDAVVQCQRFPELPDGIRKSSIIVNASFDWSKAQ